MSLKQIESEDFDKLSDKFTTSLDEFRKLVIESKRQTFWEKYSPIIIPTIISTIIGVCTFYAAFNLSEYKIGVLMDERLEIRTSIKQLETNIVRLNISNSSDDNFETYVRNELADLNEELKDVKDCMGRLEKVHEIEAIGIKNRMDNLEHEVYEVYDIVKGKDKYYK